MTPLSPVHLVVAVMASLLHHLRTATFDGCEHGGHTPARTSFASRHRLIVCVCTRASSRLSHDAMRHWNARGTGSLVDCTDDWMAWVTTGSIGGVRA